MTQWTRLQAEVATLDHPYIGSLCTLDCGPDPTIGPIPAANAAELGYYGGPFATSFEYFTAVADRAAAVARRPDPACRLGGLVLRDIIEKTALFGQKDAAEDRFPLNHMDLGTQNILVDEEFNFVAIIDWEFAQTAPWQVNHYPMPFPLLQMDTEEILKDPNHLAYKNVLKQETSRRIYRQKFQEAERKLQKRAVPSLGLLQRHWTVPRRGSMLASPA
jgi:hypothetical protein